MVVIINLVLAFAFAASLPHVEESRINLQAIRLAAACLLTMRMRKYLF